MSDMISLEPRQASRTKLKQAGQVKAPFPYFGGKSRAAKEVWARFGDVKNYIEPFAGSCAVLLARPGGAGPIETVNDADGLLSNFWRALRHDPEAVAYHADWPVNEADLHARHLWLVGERDSLTSRLMADPDWYDAKAAGWWVWGASAWIGAGWCSGVGPWQAVDGEFVNVRNAGQGVSRQIPYLGNAGSRYGRGINRAGGVAYNLFPVADRIKNTRVACGDWLRVCGSKSTTTGNGLTGVFLDPPYPGGEIDYSAGDRSTYQDVTEWALERGDDPKIRIAVCGYESDHDALADAGWTVYAWKAKGGYGSQGKGSGRKNSKRERIWFSPHCLPVAVQGAL